MTRPGIETRSPGPFGNTLNIMPMSSGNFVLIQKIVFFKKKKKIKKKTVGKHQDRYLLL